MFWLPDASFLSSLDIQAAEVTPDTYYTVGEIVVKLSLYESHSEAVVSFLS